MGILLVVVVPVTLKVRREVVELAEEMVKLGIARSRNHAFNILTKLGLKEAQRLVERKRVVARLVREFMEKGVPYENLPTAGDVGEKRSR